MINLSLIKILFKKKIKNYKKKGLKRKNKKKNNKQTCSKKIKNILAIKRIQIRHFQLLKNVILIKLNN
jgi:hypothetical protein